MIYTPDGEPVHIEWYISDGKPVGVQSISGGWIARPVDPPQPTGFAPPRDLKN